MTEYTSSGQKWLDDPAQGVVGELYAEISRELGTDGPADTFGHPDESAVGHLVEDDHGSEEHHESDVLASDSHDLEDLSAEERAMHLVDPDDLDDEADPDLAADARARLDDY
jgi:hypothetical protein